MTLNPARDTEVVAGRRRNGGSAGPRGRMPAPGSGRLQRGALGGSQSRGRRAAGEAATGRGRRPLRPRGGRGRLRHRSRPAAPWEGLGYGKAARPPPARGSKVRERGPRCAFSRKSPPGEAHPEPTRLYAELEHRIVGPGAGGGIVGPQDGRARGARGAALFRGCTSARW